MKRQIWTVGHSTRALQELVDVLVAHGIEAVADVRRFAGSRRYPQFGADSLRDGLAAADISYHHFPALGGRRTSRLASSPNSGWRVAAFKAYADYMLGKEFAPAFQELVELAERKRTAMMCAEVLPWRCHRRLLADQFIVQGWDVTDILDASQSRPHELPAFAQVDGTQLTYPGEKE